MNHNPFKEDQRTRTPDGNWLVTGGAVVMGLLMLAGMIAVVLAMCGVRL